MLNLPKITYGEAPEWVQAGTPESILEQYHRPYRLDTGHVESYRRRGFIKLSKVLDGEALEHARKVIGASVLLRKEKDKRTLAEKSQYEQSFLQCGYLCWDFPAVRDFVFGKRFAGIARDLMAVDHVRLWHDQALFKEPGGRITDMHQDISYWPVRTHHTITMWLALNDVPEERGCLYFLPETHHSGVEEYVDIFNNPHVPEKMAFMEQVSVPLQAGDATFHSGLTYHGARSNRTEDVREAMTIIYIGDGTRFDASDPRNATHTSCEGLKAGDMIDTGYTPVLA